MTTDAPDLWVCLDLCPKPGVEVPDVETIAALLQHPDTSGAGWIRNWQVFHGKQKAREYADANPTMVFLPLQFDRDARIAVQQAEDLQPT